MARRLQPQAGLIRRPPVPLDEADHHGAGAAEHIQTALSIVSPPAAGTVLLFYFGWVRTKYEVAALGYDSKILEFTTADAVLHSVNVLSPPVVADTGFDAWMAAGHLWLARMRPVLVASIAGARSA